MSRMLLQDVTPEDKISCIRVGFFLCFYTPRFLPPYYSPWCHWAGDWLVTEWRIRVNTGDTGASEPHSVSHITTLHHSSVTCHAIITSRKKIIITFHIQKKTCGKYIPNADLEPILVAASCWYGSASSELWFILISREIAIKYGK